MKLYHFDLSHYSWKVRAFIDYLGLDVELVAVEIGKHKEPEMMAKNPSGKLPFLEDGDRIIKESNAILIYLAEKKGVQFDLISSIEWMFWDNNNIVPKLNTLVTQFFAQSAGKDIDQTIINEQLSLLDQPFKILDNHLSKSEYIIGNEVSVCDFGVISSVLHSDKLWVDLEKYPNLLAWKNRMMSIPAIQSAAPKNSL